MTVLLQRCFAGVRLAVCRALGDNEKAMKLGALAGASLYVALVLRLAGHSGVR